MIRRLSLILAFLLTGCAPTPQTAREGTPLVPLSVQAVNVAPAGLRSIATPSGLQSAYNAVGRIEPNAPDGSHPNRSSPVIVGGTIKLTKQLRIPGNAVTLGEGNGGMLTWDGTEPPILFYSAVGNGATAGVKWKGVSINAPHARNLWEWDTSAHAGNAHDYTFEDCTFTTNEGTHLNLNCPGTDGRGYYFTFRNIKITGTGQIARCDGAHANPMVLFDNIQCVNRQLTGPAFDLWNTSGAIVNCWLELTNTTVLSMHGAFSLIRWQNNYIEPHNGVPNGELVKVDGYNSALLADALYFIMPAQRVVASNGGQVIFTGLPDCQNANGGHPDWTQPLATYVDHLKACFTVSGAGSQVAWPSGRVDARGVFKAGVDTAVMQEAQPSN
jgi:hypothetical protein